MCGCSNNDSQENVITYTVSREGGILGVDTSGVIAVDKSLMEKSDNQDGNFLDIGILSNLKSSENIQPDTYVYIISVLKNGLVAEVYNIPESQLSPEQLDFIDSLYAAIENKQ